MIDLKSKITSKTYNELDSHSLEEVITEFLGQKEFYSIVAAEEIGNHTWEVTVNKASKYDLSELEGAKAGNGYHTGAILNCMCSEGLLDAGEYIIDTTW